MIQPGMWDRIWKSSGRISLLLDSNSFGRHPVETERILDGSWIHRSLFWLVFLQLNSRMKNRLILNYYFHFLRYRFQYLISHNTYRKKSHMNIIPKIMQEKEKQLLEYKFSTWSKNIPGFWSILAVDFLLGIGFRCERWPKAQQWGR